LKREVYIDLPKKKNQKKKATRSIQLKSTTKKPKNLQKKNPNGRAAAEEEGRCPESLRTKRVWGHIRFFLRKEGIFQKLMKKG
jgi:hypothetical protein